MTILSLPRSLSLIVALALITGGGFLWWTSGEHGSAATPPVYVALGASDAVGIGAGRPTTEGWVPLVANGLPSRPELINLGISGATLDDVLTQELPVALDAHPDWVSIWPGVNDLRHNTSLTTFSSQLNDLLGQLERASAARMIVLNIPDLRLVPALDTIDRTSLDQTVRHWNAAIADAAQAHGAILVDLYGNSERTRSHPEDISSDGFHPSTSGYRQIADLIMKTVHADASLSSP